MTDFAAAQARILARRSSRATQAASLTAQAQAERTASLIRLPPALRVLAHHGWNAWDTVSSPYGTRPAFRVGQVDAELLDEELLNLLKNQAGDGLKLFAEHWKDDWAAEIGLGLRTVLWKLAIWDHGASYGASLQGLKYVDARSAGLRREISRWQKAAHGLLTVGGYYGWTKLTSYLSRAENDYYVQPSPLVTQLSRLMSLASSAHDLAALASFLVFLFNGKYRTLTDRLLRMRLVPSSNQTNREVSFEYLNRQLVWHAFTEFLLFLLPLVGIARWRRWIARAWKRGTASISRLRSGPSTSSDDEDVPRAELAFLPERTCAICYQDQNPTSGRSEQDVIAASANSGVIGNASTDITNPYETIPCGCIYCFVCLAQRIEAEEGEGFVCLRCGEICKSCRPWSGDVVISGMDDGVRSESGRSIGRKGSEGSGGRPGSRKSIAWADEIVDHGGEEEGGGLERTMSFVEPRPVEDDEGYGEGEGEGEGFEEP